MLVVPAGRDLVGGLGDRLGQLSAQHAELAVHPRAGALDQAEGPDLGPLQATAGDREVLDGALCLGPPQGVRGDPHLAHRVVLDAVGRRRRLIGRIASGAVLFAHAASVLQRTAGYSTRSTSPWCRPAGSTERHSASVEVTRSGGAAISIWPASPRSWSWLASTSPTLHDAHSIRTSARSSTPQPACRNRSISA